MRPSQCLTNFCVWSGLLSNLEEDTCTKCNAQSSTCTDAREKVIWIKNINSSNSCPANFAAAYTENAPLERRLASSCPGDYFAIFDIIHFVDFFVDTGTVGKFPWNDLHMGVAFLSGAFSISPWERRSCIPPPSWCGAILQQKSN